jgi:hypothetical protein
MASSSSPTGRLNIRGPALYLPNKDGNWTRHEGLFELFDDVAMTSKDNPRLNDPKLSRKERRALEFGRAEAREEVLKKIEAQKGDVPIMIIKEVDGIIRVPLISGWHHIRFYMIPYDELDPKYRQDFMPLTVTGGSTLPVYRTLLSLWFFRGLKSLSMVLKPNVKHAVDDTVTGMEATRLKQYIREVLNDCGSSHAHKMAYLTYVLDTCCESIEWVCNERGAE